MNLDLLLPLLITALITIVGWFVAHQLNSWRDSINKRREKRIEYLINAYRNLAKAVHHPRVYEISDLVESALSDIQLFGTEEQIQKALIFMKEFTSSEGADLEDLLNSLRVDLRRELKLSKINGKLWWLKIKRSSTHKLKRDRKN